MRQKTQMVIQVDKLAAPHPSVVLSCFPTIMLRRRDNNPQRRLTASLPPKSKNGTPMATGIVKFFNDTKGFGFIIPENGGQDVFVHKTAIELAGLSVLKKGEALSFELIKDKMGKLHASDLKVLGAVETLRPPIDRKSHAIESATFPERRAPSNDNSHSPRHTDIDGQPIASAVFAQKTQSNEKQSWQRNYDKYIEIARHAEDLVTREGHWQHAEHYLRLLNGSANF